MALALNWLISLPTRNKNTIDLFMTNKQSLVTRGKPLPGVSDRAIVFIEVARKSLRKRLSRSKKKAYRKAQLNSTPEDITKYKQLQNNTQQECKKAYNNFVRDTVTSYKNPKKMYYFSSSKRCESSGVQIPKSNAFGHSNPKSKAEILNSHFSSFFTEEDFSKTTTMDSV
ncbi:hypothetical protein DPMN_022516 [Dreissena polymorpha]|uniref:Uncharacterized protein n=1 Tax=Dreissena polymorpha TaxID=45954 RepID=A0A9D4SCH1_DREPO|nr:hypothetical protein DPMN_022516 [Dreissena polymorpha]